MLQSHVGVTVVWAWAAAPPAATSAKAAPHSATANRAPRAKAEHRVVSTSRVFTGMTCTGRRARDFDESSREPATGEITFDRVRRKRARRLNSILRSWRARTAPSREQPITGAPQSVYVRLLRVIARDSGTVSVPRRSPACAV